MPRVNHVKAARKHQGTCEKCGCELPVGSPYRYWEFRYGGTHKRCMKPECSPKASDLTQSEFLGQLYDLQDRLGSIESEDDRDSLADDIEQLGQEQRDKFDNMPEGLQQGDTGQLLEGRADGCDDWAERLRGHDYPTEDDLEEEQTLEQAIEDWQSEVQGEDYEGD